MKFRGLQPLRDSPLILPATFTAFVLLAGVAARAPIADVTPGGEAIKGSLQLPLSYQLIAPVSNIFDALTALSLPQVFATFAFVIVVSGVLRLLWLGKIRRRSAEHVPATAHIRFGATIIGAIIAVSGLALLMPRPMAGIHLTDPDQLAIDFHSHTAASQDGRPMFTPEANREWHRKAGFDVAYISDHHTFAGAIEAARENPHTAGEGTTLLTGLESRDGDEHVIALGLDPATTNPETHEWHPLFGRRGPSPALLILSLPGNVHAVPEDEEIGSARLSAIELSDGSPRGLEQAADEPAAIIALADSLNLALVTGSDNHGWGRTAAAWSVMRIPGWRAMTPTSLDSAIRSTIATQRRGAVEVVERTLPRAGSVLAVALTGPELAWVVSRSLSWPERFSWVAWICAGCSLAAVTARRRATFGEKSRWHIPDLVAETTPDGAPAAD